MRTRRTVGRMTSLWQLTGPSIAPFGADAVHDGARFDAVVVGAGLTGLTTATLLARAGQRVAVIEARTAGAVTTGGTTGKLSVLQGSVFTEIREHAGDEALHAYVEANREGQAWLLRELEAKGVAVDRRTAYTYTESEASLADLDREYEAGLSAGLPIRRSDDANLPFAIAGALRLDDQAQLHPMTVLAALADELRDRGGHLRDHCRLLGADVDTGHVRLATSAGELIADRCVLATGSPVLDRGLFFARLEPSRSFVCAYGIDEAVLPPGMHVSIDAPTRSLRSARDPVGNPLLVVGGGAHVTGRGGDTAARLAGIDTWTRERFAVGERVTWWAAQDYRSHSRMPFAGELPGSRGRIFAATGYNKWGMTNAISSALALVATMLGEPPVWARVMQQHRFGISAAGAAISSGSKVAARLVGGWADAEFGREEPQRDETTELAEGDGVITRDGLAPVATARVNGTICRVSGVCTHMGGVLAWNAAERSWDCPLHGSRFTADGTLLEGPAVHNLERRS